MGTNAPTPGAPTELDLESETLDVDCAPVPRSPNVRCVRTATLVASNPTDHDVDLRFWSWSREDQLWVNGQLLRSPEFSEDAPPPIRFAPGARHTVRLEGVAISDVPLWRRQDSFYNRGPLTDPHFRHAIETLHPLLGDRWQTPDRETFGFDFSSSGPWRTHPRARVRIVVPEGWQARVQQRERTALRATDVSVRHAAAADGRDALEFDAPEARDPMIFLQLRRERQPALRSGGPVLAAGVTFDQGFRLRGAWEFALGGSMLVAAAAETDFTSRVQLTPYVMAATPGWSYWPFTFFPSVGLGLGPVIRLLPDYRAALRAIALVSGPLQVLGVEFTLDYWIDNGSVESTLMLRVGL